MKPCILPLVLGFCFSLESPGFAGVMDDEYVRPDGYTQADVNSFKADVAEANAGVTQSQDAKKLEKAEKDARKDDKVAACKADRKAAESAGAPKSVQPESCKAVDVSEQNPKGSAGRNDEVPDKVEAIPVGKGQGLRQGEASAVTWDKFYKKKALAGAEVGQKSLDLQSELQNELKLGDSRPRTDYEYRCHALSGLMAYKKIELDIFTGHYLKRGNPLPVGGQCEQALKQLSAACVAGDVPATAVAETNIDAHCGDTRTAVEQPAPSPNTAKVEPSGQCHGVASLETRQTSYVSKPDKSTVIVYFTTETCSTGKVLYHANGFEMYEDGSVEPWAQDWTAKKTPFMKDVEDFLVPSETPETFYSPAHYKG